MKFKPALLVVSVAALITLSAVYHTPRDTISGNTSDELVTEEAVADQSVALGTLEKQAAPASDPADKTTKPALNSYLQAWLIDEDVSQTTTLRVTGITESKDFVQYSVESSDGELGIVTASPGRVFAFLQTKDGVYEYAGDNAELKLSKSYLTGLEEDFRRPKVKTLRVRR